MNDIEKLFSAVKKGQLKAVRRLIEQGVPVNVAEEVDGWWTPLHFAVTRGHPEICALLLDAGADVHKTTAHGFSPLHFASKFPDICSLLLQSGASVNFNCDENFIPLHAAARNDAVEACRILLAHGAQTTYCLTNPKPDYLTPFQEAVRYGAVDVVRMMVRECGEQLDQTTRAGQSLLDVTSSVFMHECLLALQTELAIEQSMPSAGEETTSLRRTAGLSPL